MSIILSRSFSNTHTHNLTAAHCIPSLSSGSTSGRALGYPLPIFFLDQALNCLSVKILKTRCQSFWTFPYSLLLLLHLPETLPRAASISSLRDSKDLICFLLCHVKNFLFQNLIFRCRTAKKYDFGAAQNSANRCRKYDSRCWFCAIFCADPSLYDYAPFLSFTQQEIKNRQVPNQPCRFPIFLFFCFAPPRQKPN